MEPALLEVLKNDQQIGASLQFTEEGLAKRKRDQFTAKNLYAAWKDLIQQTERGNIDDLDAQYVKIVAHIRTMITHAGDTSNLILDPDLDSYYLMDVTLLALPQSEDRLQEIIHFIQKIERKGSITQEERIQASVYAAMFKESDIDRVVASSQTSINEDANFYEVSPTLQSTLPERFKAIGDKNQLIFSKLRELGGISDIKLFDFTKTIIAASEMANLLFDYQDVAIQELNTLLQLRMKSIEADKSAAILWTSISLMVSLLLAAGITFRILQRLKHINATSKNIASGDLAARVGLLGRDEIGELAISFDTMSENVANLNGEIERRNEELKSINGSLETIVEERTATIKVILDNVKFGFILIDHSRLVMEGFSHSCLELLGSSLAAGRSYTEVFGLVGNRNEAMYSEFLDQAFEDFLPEEMTLMQLPTRVKIDNRILSLQASLVRNSDKSVKCILFTVIDATTLEHAEAENRLQKVLLRLLKDMDSFKSFVLDGKNILERCRNWVATGNQERLRAELHTLKGNAGAFEMTSLAARIHEVEELAFIESLSVDEIQSELFEFLEKNYDVLGLSATNDDDGMLTIKQETLKSVKDKFVSLNSKDEKISYIDSWMNQLEFKSAKSLLGPLPEYCEKLAKRLEKEVKIEIAGGEIQVDPKILRPIMQGLVHMIRNSIDHGIESSDERIAQDKPSVGLIQINIGEQKDCWTLDICDDGQGINFEKLLESAIAKGLITQEQSLNFTFEQKINLIFADNLSSAKNISDVSGRGVGMGAVQRLIFDAGGTLDVHTERGKGTRFEIKIPRVVEIRRVA